MSEWQPIATAPNDGRKVLVSAWFEGVMLFAEIAERAPYEAGVFLRSESRSGRIETATHWAPMPEAPK